MSDRLDRFGRQLGEALTRYVDALAPERDTDAVASRAMAVRSRRRWWSQMSMPGLTAGAVVAVVAIVTVASGRLGPPPGGVANTTPTASADASTSDIVHMPWDGGDFGLEPETVTVNGILYYVSIARGLSVPDGLQPAGKAMLNGQERDVFRLPGVAERAGLLISTSPGEGDDLGPYPPYLLLIGPQDPFPAICDYFPVSTPERCESA